MAGPSGAAAAGEGGDPRLLVLGGLALLGTIIGAGAMLWLNRRSSSSSSKGHPVGRVASIVVYPLKSARGIPVDASLVEPRGLVFDRLWMVVSDSGRFRSQRQVPKMSQIQPRLPGGMTEPLVLSAPGMPTISVPVCTTGKSTEVRVWGDTCKAYDQGEEAALWLSTFLGEKGLRLVRMDEKERRQVDRTYAVRGQTTGFADGFPFLLANQSSLDDLNTHLAQPITMNRFRPNIIVEGPQPWAEDKWHRIAIGGMALRVAKPCARCKVPNIDQETSEGGTTVTNALKAFRTGEQLGIDVGDKTDVYFGWNLVNDKRTGILRVGDPVTIFS